MTIRDVAQWYENVALPRAKNASQGLADLPDRDRKRIAIQQYMAVFPWVWRAPITTLSLEDRLHALVWLSLTIAQHQSRELLLPPVRTVEKKFFHEKRGEWTVELPEAIASGSYVRVAEEAGDCFFYILIGWVRSISDGDDSDRWLHLYRMLAARIRTKVDNTLGLEFFSAAAAAKWRRRSIYSKNKPWEYQDIAVAINKPQNARF